MTTGDDKLDAALRALSVEYLAAAPERLAELWSALERVQNGDRGGLEALRLRTHRLAGSGGGYGFPELSTAARAADQACGDLIARPNVPEASDVAHLRRLVQGVADAFAKAQTPE